MTRWIIRALILLIILIIAALVTTHFVLRSDLPRSVLVNILRDRTGLKIEAGALDVSWSGHTVLEDLSVTLPLEDEPFVSVRRVRVKHHALLRLALSRSLGLSDVRIVDPVVSLRADPGEQWNLIEAAEIVSLALARGADPNRKPSAVPDLPRLRIERAAVEVDLPDGRELDYSPISIEGDPEGALAWRFAVTLEDRIALRGQLAPGAGWDHRLSFSLDEIRSLVEPFVAALPEPLDASGHWRGNIRSGTLAGSLTLDSVHVGRFNATGSIGAEMVGTDLTATPNNLVLWRDPAPDDQREAHAEAGPSAVPDRVHISGGTFQANLQQLSASAIVGRLEGYADFQIDGAWSLADSSGSADLLWRGIATRLMDDPVEHRGQINAEMAITPLGRLGLAAELSSSGSAPQGTWDLAGSISASGDSIDTLSIRLELPTAKLVAPQFASDLDGLVAEADLNLPMISGARLLIPDARPDRAPLMLTADGDVRTLDWAALADAEGYTPPISAQALPDIPPLSIGLRATGDQARAVLESLNVSNDQTTLTAQGRITLADMATELSIAAEQRQFTLGQSLSGGSLSMSAEVAGSLSPLNLEADGTLTIVEPRYREQLLRTVTTTYAASADDDAYTLSVDPFDILDGRVRARAAFTRGESEVRLAFTGDTISLSRIAEVLAIPATLTGTTSAELAASIPLDDPARAVASGTWTASGVNIADLALIDGEGTLTAGNGALRLPQLTLRNADGVLRGNAAMDLNRTDRLHAVFALEGWPLELEGPSLAITADGEADLFIDLVPLGATRTINLSADLRYQDQAGATLTLDSSIEGRDLSVDSMTAQTLGGSAQGSGLLPLSAEFWDRARFTIDWSEIDFAEARGLIPALEPFTGTTAGRLDIRPTEDPRADQPLQLTIESNFTDARFADFTLGAGERERPDLNGLVHFGPGRAEIQEGSLVAADGTLDLYGRASDHGGEVALFMNLTMNNLDLQQIASAAALDDRPMPGRVSGEWTLGGSLTPPHRLFGRATMTLTDSDLLALPGIAQIYGALNLDIGTSKPQGEGEVLLRIEGRSLEITRLIYFNRGTDVVAGLKIADIFNPAESPIEGIAVGSIRPLRAGSQSFFSSIDRLLRAAQSNAVAVEIGGTIAEPTTSLAPLKDLTDSIRRLLRGSAD
jgi:hypothetical protein